jgi:hypothetical protein
VEIQTYKSDAGKYRTYVPHLLHGQAAEALKHAINQIICQSFVIFCVTRPFFLSSSQEDPTPEHRRNYSGIYPESSFNHDSEYVIKNVVSTTRKQI